MSYIQKYYTLDLIPEYRLKFIKIKIKQFINDYKLNRSPLDCVKLLKKIKLNGMISLQIGITFSTSARFDAQARYYSKYDLYVIIINGNKMRYPFKSSKDRRLNFTLAHEIAHIFLDHLKIPNHLKSIKQKEIEEEEANEFAGRVLLPRQKIMSCNFVSIEKVAKHFIVSEQALWKRLNHLKRLDLIKSAPLTVCDKCGNNELSPFVEYCKVCGDIINSPRGIEIMIYDSYELNENGKVSICPICNNEEVFNDLPYCKICGSYLINKCTWDECDYTSDGNARYCERCGSKTTFFKEKYLRDWKEAKALIEEKGSSLYPLEVTSEQPNSSTNSTQEISFNEDDIPF